MKTIQQRMNKQYCYKPLSMQPGQAHHTHCPPAAASSMQASQQSTDYTKEQLPYKTQHCK
jgi:hypothetical protein